MAEDDRELVLNWFQRRALDPKDRPFSLPRIESPLRELQETRPDVTPGEARLLSRGLAVRELPVPSQNLIDWVGGGDAHVFQTVGLLNFYQLITYAGLAPTSRILEPGCGCGRNARYIAPLLDPKQGSYDGFDIEPEGIEWANRTIGSVYANCRFAHADIHNTNYNSEGKIDAGSYSFPYEEGAFDLVFLPSVFTHLTKDAFENYVHEIARVVAPGGVLLSWNFLLNDEARRLLEAGAGALPFQPFGDGCWVHDPENPSAAIAFDERWVLGLLEDSGLRTQFILRGAWAGGRPDGIVDAQDRLLATRAF